MFTKKVIRIGLLLIGSSSWCSAQQPSQSPAILLKRAKENYNAGKYPTAEGDLRNLLKVDPLSLYGQLYLGYVMFEQEKYLEAIAPFENAKALNRMLHKLSQDDNRVLTTQLVESCFVHRKLEKIHPLLDEAIEQDPKYPYNYLQLAEAYAEEGDKEKALANISLAFKNKDHLRKGERLPDPRRDLHLDKYGGDPDFISLMEKLGYK